MAVPKPCRKRTIANCQICSTNRYRNGTVERTKEEMINILLRPNRSAIKPAGMLNRTPVKADTAATMPTPDGSAPKWAAKSGSTGLFEIVELKIAKKPVIQKNLNGLIVSDLPQPRVTVG
jgi:hypothetical protein